MSLYAMTGKPSSIRAKNAIERITVPFLIYYGADVLLIKIQMNVLVQVCIEHFPVRFLYLIKQVD